MPEQPSSPSASISAPTKESLLLEGIHVLKEERLSEDLYEVHLQIDERCPRFIGHFDGAPLLPALSLLHDLVRPYLRKAFSIEEMGGLRGVKLRKKVEPGAELRMQLRKKDAGILVEIRSQQEMVLKGRVVALI